MCCSNESIHLTVSCVRHHLIPYILERMGEKYIPHQNSASDGAVFQTALNHL